MEPGVLSRTDREELDAITEELEKVLPASADRETVGAGELFGGNEGLKARTGLWAARKWKPFPWQAQLTEEIGLPPGKDGPRRYAVNAGRGVGKTTLAPELVWEAATMEWDDDLGPPHVKVFADTYEHGQKIWSPVWTEAATCLASLVLDRDGDRNLITLRSVEQPSERGATIQLLSADNPNAMTGHNDMTVAIADESQFIKDASWLQFFPCMNIRHAVLVAFGVCQGVGQYRTMSYKGMQRFDWPDHRTIRVPSTRNPYFTREMDEAARRNNTPEDYLNLYQVLWGSGGGALFENVEGCIINPGIQLRLVNGRPLIISAPRATGDYTAGLDIAKARDYMACTIWERETGRLVAVLRANKRTYTFLEALVARFLLAYKPIVYVDVTSMGRAPYEHIARYVREKEREQREASLDEGMERKTRFVEVDMQGGAKAEMIDGLAIKLVQERMRFAWVVELVSELEVFEKEVTPSGNLKYGAPRGMHDDLVISMGLAALGLPKAKASAVRADRAVRVERGWEKMKVSRSGW